MQKLLGILVDNMPATVAGTASASAGVAGLAGAIPDGIPQWAWALLTLLGPIVSALFYKELRVLNAKRVAKKRALADEEKRLATVDEQRARALLEDKNPDNDGDADKLRASARKHRQAAVIADAEADAIERESVKA